MRCAPAAIVALGRYDCVRRGQPLWTAARWQTNHPVKPAKGLFNGLLRGELLAREAFDRLLEAQVLIERRR